MNKTSPQKEPQTEIQQFHSAVKELNMQYRKYNKFRWSMAMSFLKGVATALGAIAAVVIVLPVIAAILQSVNWPPIIADQISQIILQMEQANRR